MRSFLARNGRLHPRAATLPRLRSGWALVRVRLSGVCNTDLEILRGYFAFPGTPGHEFVGEVAEVRAGRRGVGRWVGRRVVGEINIGCASLGLPPCGYCRRGLVRHCARRRVLGIVAQDGAFAEYLTLPLANLHPVPDSVPDEQAVFTEPLAAACEIIEQVRIARHREAAVLGDGKLAQLIARVLRAAGLRVTMFGRHAHKLALARKAGIETRRAPDGAAPVALRQRYTLTVEATGSPAGLELAQQMTAPRGTLVLKSTFHGAARTETWPIVVNELTVVGSRCGPFPRALALLRGGKMDLRPLISRVFPLREAPAALRYAARRGVLKVLLKP